jgi:hypothetical protein
MLPRPGGRRTSIEAMPISTLGYFENTHGEQALSSTSVTRGRPWYLGDAGWDASHVVVDGSVPDLVLNESERLWLRACWQACRGE